MQRRDPNPCSERRGEWHYGEELRESAEERAEGLIRAALKRKGWMEKDLQERRKGDEFKVRLAEQLRAETTVTLRWIAARLCMALALTKIDPPVLTRRDPPG